MPFQLHTAKGRKGEKYQRAAAEKLGSWNADMPDGALPRGDFSQLKNWRKSNPTEIEIRSGYKEYLLQGAFIPMAVTEYRLDDLFRDITFYLSGSDLKVLILNTIDGSQINQTVITGGMTADTKVFAGQYNTFLIFTVYGMGVYSMQPNDTDLSGWDDPVLLGKQPASVPLTYTFPDTVTGDLIVFDNTSLPLSTTKGMEYNYGINQKEPTKIRLDIGATYTRTNAPAITALKFLKRWVFGKDDASLDGQMILTRTVEQTNHLRTNGWGYKTVFVRRFTDVKGQVFTSRSNPSSDFWVGDQIFAPPFWVKFLPSIHANGFPNETQPAPNGDGWDLTNPFLFFVGSTGTGAEMALPSTDAVRALSKLFQLHFNNSAESHSDPYFFVALWLYWGQTISYFLSTNGDGAAAGQPPYKVEVPISELKGAPMTVFTLADFANVPSDVIAIEFYRTAYSQADDKDNSSLSPLFQPYRYGYVGQIKIDGISSDESFTDDVSDQQIDFSSTPDDFIGYNNDEFSGAVLTRYGDNNVVLGDTITKYSVSAPAAFPQVLDKLGQVVASGQAFAFTKIDIHSGDWNKSDFTGDAGDGQPQVVLSMQYVDDEGNVSDATPIVVDTSIANSGPVSVAIVPPRGYAANIVSLVFWQGIYDAGNRDYTKLTTISIPAASVVLNAPVAPFPDYIPPQKNVVISEDNPAWIWNDGSSLDVWPQENFNSADISARVTGFGIVSGMLGVFLDSAYWATNLKDRTEIINNRVGLISRWAIHMDKKIQVFLSQYGLYLAEGSGIRELPTDIQTEVFKYLHEEIPGQPSLANARRASLGWLGQRNEIWLYFPSSFDLGGFMPSRCFIYHIGNMKSVDNYEFDLAGIAPEFRTIFNSHADGKLFCSYVGTMPNPEIPALVVQDNDFGTYWPGSTYAEMLWGMETPEIKKRLRSVMFTGEIHADIKRIIGLMRNDGIVDPEYGSCNENADVKQLTIRGGGFLQQFRFNASQSLFNTTGYVPVTRFITFPNDQGEHHGRICSVEILFKSDHKHP